MNGLGSGWSAPEIEGPTPSDCSTSNEVNMTTPVDMLATAAGRTSAEDASGADLSSLVRSRSVREWGYLFEHLGSRCVQELNEWSTSGKESRVSRRRVNEQRGQCHVDKVSAYLICRT